MAILTMAIRSTYCCSLWSRGRPTAILTTAILTTAILLQVPIAIIGGNCAEQNAFIADLYEKEHDQSLAKVLGLP